MNDAFSAYYLSLPRQDDEVQKHFQIKKSHTYRVVRNMKTIAAMSGFSRNDVEMAMIIGLLHDIARFEQFARYHTFNDDISENHAEMAVRIIAEQQFLDGFKPEKIDIIIRSILHHNIPHLPVIKDPEILRFSYLLRDADKLDIWKLTVEQNIAFTVRNEKESDSYIIPPGILQCLRERRIVYLSLADSMNDFRLLRLSWLADMNFPATFYIIKKRGYINKIMAKIPPFREKEEITAILHEQCNRRIGMA
jgi:hypothetical protein